MGAAVPPNSTWSRVEGPTFVPDLGPWSRREKMRLWEGAIGQLTRIAESVLMASGAAHPLCTLCKSDCKHGFATHAIGYLHLKKVLDCANDDRDSLWLATRVVEGRVRFNARDGELQVMRQALAAAFSCLSTRVGPQLVPPLVPMSWPPLLPPLLPPSWPPPVPTLVHPS